MQEPKDANKTHRDRSSRRGTELRRVAIVTILRYLAVSQPLGQSRPRNRVLLKERVRSQDTAKTVRLPPVQLPHTAKPTLSSQPPSSLIHAYHSCKCIAVLHTLPTQPQLNVSVNLHTLDLTGDTLPSSIRFHSPIHF